MKNEWDMFAAVQQRLAAGEQLVKLYLTTPREERVEGELGQALDEDGEAYELGAEFPQALQACIRDRRISWAIHHGSKTLSFGPGLNDKGPRPALPGEQVINLLDESVDLHDLFGSGSEDDDYNDTWWRPQS